MQKLSFITQVKWCWCFSITFYSFTKYVHSFIDVIARVCVKAEMEIFQKLGLLISKAHIGQLYLEVSCLLHVNLFEFGWLKSLPTLRQKVRETKQDDYMGHYKLWEQFATFILQNIVCDPLAWSYFAFSLNFLFEGHALIDVGHTDFVPSKAGRSTAEKGTPCSAVSTVRLSFLCVVIGWLFSFA